MSGARTRRLIGSVLGLGRAPLAPGTAASLAVVLAAGLLLGVEDVHAGWLEPWLASTGAGPWTWRGVLAALIAVLVAVGLVVGRRAEADWGAEDPSAFVLDEVVGQALALLVLVPGPVDGLSLALAFVAFRLFDILKPPPCRALERLPGGVGIMADDVAAGLYALLVVLVVRI